MAERRTVMTNFWSDSKVAEMSTDERLLFLYFLTNSHTNMCGCYEISMKQVSFETGLSDGRVGTAIKSLADVDQILAYSEATKEILIVNWYKYNWNCSSKLRTGIRREIGMVKSDYYKAYLLARFNGEDTSYVPYGYMIDTVSVKNKKPETVERAVINDATAQLSDAEKDAYIMRTYKEVVDYFNLKCGTRMRTKTKETQKYIYERLRQGYTKRNFLDVIDKKSNEWIGTPQQRYLRPGTLFGQNFDEYIKQADNLRMSRDEKAINALGDVTNGDA